MTSRPAHGLVRLTRTADKRQARTALLKLLAAEPYARTAENLMDRVVQPDPTAPGTWAIQPTVKLLAAARGYLPPAYRPG